MKIVISNPDVIERINKLADELNQAPEQIIANAIELQWPKPNENGKAFWNAIRGIGDSGDPDLAHRLKDILRDEVDPIEGWGKPRDSEGTDRR
jgi:hypothetical protein